MQEAIVRVAALIPDLGMGGAERMVIHLLAALSRSGFDVSLITLFDGGHEALLREVQAYGIQLVQLGKRPGPDARMPFAIRRALQNVRPDIVHTHRYALAYAVPAILASKFAVVHTVHNIAEKESHLVGRIIQRLAFKKGVIPVAIAEEVARSIRRVYGLLDVPVIPNGIPVRSYAAGDGDRAMWRARHGFADEQVLFVCVARLSPQKNHELLLHAFARHVARSPDSRLVLVGDGPLREHILERIEGLELGGRVVLLGTRNDVADILAAADVFVLASAYEGNPLSVMEAMASGIPVLCTSVGGVPELVADGITGFLVPPGDEYLLADRMTRLASDPAMRKRMGRAGRCVAEERFDVHRMAEAYGELFRRLSRLDRYC